MAKVIDLQGRKDAQQKQCQKLARRRARAVAVALSCGLCPRRCARCGLAIEDPSIDFSLAPYPLCQACLEEYQAFCRRQKCQSSPEAFWHNSEWVAMWQAWLKLMNANANFNRSREFLQLMEEYHD